MKRRQTLKEDAVPTIFTFSKKRRLKRKSKNTRDTERRTLIEETIASTSVNNLPNPNSPFGVDENEVVDCPSVDERTICIQGVQYRNSISTICTRRPVDP